MDSFPVPGNRTVTVAAANFRFALKKILTLFLKTMKIKIILSLAS